MTEGQQADVLADFTDALHAGDVWLAHRIYQQHPEMQGLLAFLLRITPILRRTCGEYGR